MNTTAERVKAHTQGRLEVTDSRRIGVVLPNEIGGGFDSHCIAITHADASGLINAEANGRRLVACWNACRRFETDLLERVSRPGCYGIHPAPQDRIEELLAALEMLLASHDATCVGEDCQLSGVDLARAAIAKVKGGAA